MKILLNKSYNELWLNLNALMTYINSSEPMTP